MAVDFGRFSALVGRVGLGEAAKRIRVTSATLKRWLKSGKVSRSHEADAAGAIRRSEVSLKGAETTRKRRAESEKLGLDFPLPPSQRSGEHLTEKQLTPKIHPLVDPRIKKLFSRLPEGWHEVETDRWLGVQKHYEVQKDYRQVDLAEWTNLLITEWRASGRKWASVQVAAITHYPWNPAYKGALLRKKGHWSAPYYFTSKPAATENDVKRLIDEVFLHSKRSGRRQLDAASIDAQSQERHVFVLYLRFHFFTEKPGLPTTRAWIDEYVPPEDRELSPPRRRRKRK